MSSVFDLMATLSLDSQGYEKGLDDAKKSGIQKLGSGLKTAAKVGAAAMGAATAAAGAFAVSSVKAGLSFDKAMAQVAATMGVGVDEIQDLNEFAQEMGRTTKFSATEAAEALNYMALAGYDADTAMKMLPNVLSLAAAGDMSLATASDMVTDAQTALGLSLDETTEMVDKMARASSKSNTSVAQLGEAFLTVGGTAQNLSGGTTELSTALGILADNGIKGSEGGRSLRNVILALAAPTDQAAQMLESLGVNAFDADGNMRPLEETFKDLNDALGDMTQQQKTQALSTIFNKVDIKSANALLGTSVDRWKELSGEIDNAAGAAQTMAETQLDNLAGDITIFQSALEGAKIAVSNKLTPSLRNLVQVGTSAISDMTAAFNEKGLQGALEVFNEYVDRSITSFAEKFPTILDTVSTVLGGFVSSIIDNAPAILKALGDAIVDISGHIIDYIPNIVDAGIDLFLALADGLVQALPDIIKKLGEAIPKIAQSIAEHTGDIIKAGWELFKALGEGLLKAIPDIVKSIPNLLLEVGKGLLSGLDTIFTDIEGLFIDRTETLTAEEQKIIDKIHEEQQAVEDMMAKREEDNASIDAQYGHYEWLLRELDLMVDADGKVKEGYEERARTVTGVLQEAFGVEIDMINNTITNYQDLRSEIESVIATEKARALLNADAEEYSLAIQNQDAALQSLMAIENDVNTTRQKLTDITLEYDNVLEQARQEEEQYGYVTEGTHELIDQLEEDFQHQNDRLVEQQSALADANQTYSDYMAVIEQNEGLMAAVAEGDVGAMNQAINDLTQDFRTATNSTKQDLESQVRNTKQTYEDLVEAHRRGDQRVTDQMIQDSLNRYDRAKDELNKFQTMQTDIFDKTGEISNENLRERYSEAINDVGNFRTKMVDALNDTSDFVNAGSNIVDGISRGIDNRSAGLYSKAANLASNIAATINKSLQIKSPSRVMMTVGKMIDEGLAKGMEENAPYDVAKEMSQGIVDLFENPISRSDFGYSSAFGDNSSSQRGLVVNMTINGAQGQDVEELAELVSDKIDDLYSRRKAVYA